LSNGEELDSDIAFLNQLIPSAEDYFSIAYTLDTLSRKTNFIVTDYSVDLRQSNSNKLKLTINGVGDRASFLKFLKDYNYGGGRFITSGNIELLPQQAEEIKVDVTFYNKGVSVDKNNQVIIDSQSIQAVNNLKNKVGFVIKSEAPQGTPEGTLDMNYLKKSNPF